MTEIVEGYAHLPHVTECASVSSSVPWRNLSLNVDWMRNQLSKDINCSGLQRKSEYQNEPSRDPPPVGIDFRITPTGTASGAPGETRTHNHLIRRTPGVKSQHTYSPQYPFSNIFGYRWGRADQFFLMISSLSTLFAAKLKQVWA